MTTDLIALPAQLTAGAAIDRLRELQPEPELTYYLYVIDGQGRLDGVISLRNLVVAKPETPISEIMDRNVMKVDATSPKEEVASLIAKYNLLALPVVDARPEAPRHSHDRRRRRHHAAARLEEEVAQVDR
jgi:magnesium transporter